MGSSADSSVGVGVGLHWNLAVKFFLGDPEDDDDAIEERDVVAESGQ